METVLVVLVLVGYFIAALGLALAQWAELMNAKHYERSRRATREGAER